MPKRSTPKPSRDELLAAHHEQKLGVVALAKLFKTRDVKIRSWLTEYGIEMIDTRKLRTEPRKNKPSAEELHRLHHAEGKTINAIAKELSVSHPTVSRWLAMDGIEEIQWQKVECPVSHEELVRLHQTMLVSELAQHFGVSPTPVRRWLIEAGITRRYDERLPVPADLAEKAVTMTLPELEDAYEVTVPLLKRWFRDAGITYIDKRSPTKPSRETLVDLHHIQRKGLREIADDLETSFVIVKRWIQEYGIEQRIYGEYLGPSRDVLLDLHHKQRLSAPLIGKKFGVSNNAARMWLLREGIEILNLSRDHVPPREELERLHLTEEMPANAIAREYDVTGGAVLKWLRHYNIEVRRFESFPERQIKQLLETHNIAFEANNRKVLNGLELDVYVPGKNVAIEYCGLHWHSERFGKGSDYHALKMELCARAGIQLVTIFEDEWVEAEDACRSAILAKLGVFERRLTARRCTLVTPSREVAQAFFSQHHIQGASTSATEFVALEHDGSIVAAMALGKHHYGSPSDTVISRICFARGTQVVGGAQKLLSAARHRPLITWSDNRWSQGGLYERLGFELDDELAPAHSYCRGAKRLSTRAARKRFGYVAGELKEHEWFAQQGWYRIWDCGKKRWRLE